MSEQLEIVKSTMNDAFDDHSVDDLSGYIDNFRNTDAQIKTSVHFSQLR